MCGIFGYLGAEPPDLDTFRAAFAGARRRGPDAAGAWVEGHGRVVGVGPDAPRIFDEVVDAARRPGANGWHVVLGHCRLATAGGWREPENAQPLTFRSGVLAHNGNIPHHRRLAVRHGVSLWTGVDSELIGALVDAGRAESFEEAFGLVDPGGPVALLASGAPGSLKTFRRRHPLVVLERTEGVYVSSHLAGGTLLPEGRWVELRGSVNC